MIKRITMDEEPELVELLEAHPDQPAEAITMAYLLGKYTDVEVSVRKKPEENKVILSSRQEVDLVGMASGLMTLFRQRKDGGRK